MKEFSLNKSQLLLLLIVVIITVVYINLASLTIVGDSANIWIEAEDAVLVRSPLFVKKMEGASKDYCIQAIGGHLNTTGFAKYDVILEKEDEYFIWARCFWPGVCSNAFMLSINNSSKITVGENSLVNQWHWIKFTSHKFKRGKNEILLWNREQDSRIDMFCLTTDPNYIPSGKGNANDIFVDFNDGLLPSCIKTSHNDHWLITEEQNGNKCLQMPNGIVTKEAMQIELPVVDDYVCILSVKGDTCSKDLEIFLRYTDDSNYLSLSLHENIATIFEAKDGVTKKIKELNVLSDLVGTKYATFGIKRYKNNVTIKNNGKTIFNLIDDTNSGKYLGLMSLSSKICIDNISLTRSNISSYSNNFHVTSFSAYDDMPEILPGYFERIKEGKENWWIISGEWDDIYTDAFESLEGIPDYNEEDAKIVFGDTFGKDYSLKVAVKSNSEGAVGVIFNFQDIANYYVFKWVKENGIWLYKLCRVQDSCERILYVTNAVQKNNCVSCWYNVMLNRFEDHITVSIDKQKVIDIVDSTFSDGKVGFWTTDKLGANFDDIELTPVKQLVANSSDKYSYELFSKTRDISSDYADWINAPLDIIKLVKGRDGAIYVCLDKPIFQNAMLINKNMFHGDLFVRIRTNKIPRDVNVEYVFNLFSNGIVNPYRFKISGERLLLFKNSKLLTSVSCKTINVDNLEVGKIDGSWIVKSNGIPILNYSDKLIHDSTTISVGYSGIGKTKIVLDSIIIQDKIQLLKNGF